MLDRRQQNRVNGTGACGNKDNASDVLLNSPKALDVQEIRLVDRGSSLVAHADEGSGNTVIHDDHEGSGDTIVLSDDNMLESRHVLGQDCEITSAFMPIDVSNEQEKMGDSIYLDTVAAVDGERHSIQDLKQESGLSVQTPKSSLISQSGTNIPSKSKSDLKQRSISSVRVVSLRAAGRRAAVRNLSGSSGKNKKAEAINKHGGDEASRPIHRLLRSTTGNNAKLAVDKDTLGQGTEGLNDSDAIVQLTKRGEDLSQHCEVFKKMKSVGGHISTSIESISLELKTSHQNGSSHMPCEVRPGTSNEADRQCKHQSCCQKAKQQFPEAHSELCCMDLHANCPEPTCDVQKHGLLPSGLVMGSSNLSHHESQEPDEESLADALNMVDKLVWTNSTCMSQDTGTVSTPAHDSLRDGLVSKGLQALAHTAEKRVSYVNLDIYDWVDSQQEDPGLSSDSKEDPILPLQSQIKFKTKCRKPTRGVQKRTVNIASPTAHNRNNCSLASPRKKVIDTGDEEMNMGSNDGNGMELCSVLTRRQRNRNTNAVYPKKRAPQISEKSDEQKSADRKHLPTLAQQEDNAHYNLIQTNGIDIKSRKCDEEDNSLDARNCERQSEFTELTSLEQQKHSMRKKPRLLGNNFVNEGPRTRSKAQGLASAFAEVVRNSRTRQRKGNDVCVGEDMPISLHAPPMEIMELKVMGRCVPQEFAAKVEGQKNAKCRTTRANSISQTCKRKRHEIKSLEQRKEVFVDDLESGVKADITGMAIARRTRSRLMGEALGKSDMPLLAASKDHLTRSRNDKSKSKDDTGDIKQLMRTGLVTKRRSRQQEEEVQNTKQFMRYSKSKKEDRCVMTKVLESTEVLQSAGQKEKGNKRSRRKRQPGNVCVLFSHSLPEETVKHQKKILEKLGGHLVESAANCTHFVTNCFMRSRNMLESIAAGKAIVTPLWLDSCGQACYFVDEKIYILKDFKKEKELSFSLEASLHTARHRPLLKGMKVLLGPNVNPDVPTLSAIIESAGGQTLKKSVFLKPDVIRDDTSFIVATEKDLTFCLPLLQKGFKVYSTELILRGIVTQYLDFSRGQSALC